MQMLHYIHNIAMHERIQRGFAKLVRTKLRTNFRGEKIITHNLGNLEELVIKRLYMRVSTFF